MFFFLNFAFNKHLQYHISYSSHHHKVVEHIPHQRHRAMSEKKKHHCEECAKLTDRSDKIIHNKVCDYTPVECEFCHEAEILRKDIEHHHGAL